MDPDQFIDIVKGIVRQEIEQDVFALGTIDSGYTSGRPNVRFDGESSASVKPYPYLSSYAPAADERILLAKVGTTWMILGKVM